MGRFDRLMWTNTHNRYGLISILLHWLMAIAVFVMFALGLYMTDLDYYDPWYHRGPDLHKSAGMILLLTLAIRFLWRHMNPRPTLTGQPWAQGVARLVHAAHYFLMTAIMISGYLIPTAAGAPIDVFGILSIPSLVQLTGAQEDLAGQLHGASAWILMGLVLVHTLAACKHHFIDRDDTLLRMFGRQSK